MEEVEKLEAELDALIRKLWGLNLYTQESVDRILRGLRYEESLGMPPSPQDRH